MTLRCQKSGKRRKARHGFRNALINAIVIGKDIFSKLAKQIEVCLMTEAAIKGIKAGTMLRKMVKEGQKET